ncbi:MAG: 4Fe-4S dicluster domain-containing protein [Chloroflexi bacterium]|nr:4Fe-4S dicluster domain-containing protein [Chloroflexota bacterium]
MTDKPLNLDARLGFNYYEIDTENNHIHLDMEKCQACAARPCLTVCPAQVYLWVEGQISVRYENCLECGTCQVACDQVGNRGLTWRNPTNGLGIQFRWG